MQAVARELTAPHYSTFERDREARIVPGSRLLGGRLEIVEELARGGMSVVYRAIDRDRGGLHVALKIVTAEADRPETAARCENEARLGASLAGHPHVVRSLAVGRLDGPKGFEGRMYLVSELVGGVSLDLLMVDHHTGLAWRRACALARDVARALVDLHERGIVHRDIKPGNVLVTDDGRETAKLIDFGLAYATGDGWEEQSPDLTQDGHAPGTILYMSPQQAAHKRPEPSMDVYSFGVMLYELFAGSPPYDKLGVGELIARKCDPKRSPFPIAKMCPELDSRLTELVDRCIRFEPSERPTAAELVVVLDDVLGVLAIVPAPVVVLSSAAPDALVAPPYPPRGWRAWLVRAAVVLGVSSGVAGLLSRPSDAPELAAPVAVGHAPEPPVVPAMASTADAKVTDGSGPDPREPESLEDEPPLPSKTLPKPDVSPHKPSPISPTPKRRPGVRAERPPKPEAVPDVAVDRCPAEVREATAAAGKRRWGRVLRLTKSAECWKRGTAGARAKLRTEAFFATERFTECAKAGRGSTDPDVVRWTHICEVKSGGGTP